MTKRIRREKIRHYSGWHVSAWGGTAVLRDGYYQVLNHSIAGDAPKKFIRVYSFGEGVRRNPQTWPSFIAKVGHKSYPTESITEQLTTRIGQILGLKMAESQLALAHGQVRFLSRYFLNNEQSLVHGAQVFAVYMEDEDFVHEVETARQEADIFTFQVVSESLKSVFPDEHSDLLASFVSMLAFDAIVGNHDRHHYNWGVIVHARDAHRPYFAPIYDSARALFWNMLEREVAALMSDSNRRKDVLEGYILRSQPQTGWDGESGLNHFELISLISKESSSLRSGLTALVRPDLHNEVRNLMEREFQNLLSPNRMSLIAECLRLRMEHFANALV